MPHEGDPGSPASAPARRHGEVVLSLHARVLDIGLAGLAIETDTRLTPDHGLGLRIGSTTGELELSGRIVWCFFHGTSTGTAGEQQPVYRAGIEFADVLTPRATELLRFLEAHAVVTMETRLFGRFRLDEAGPVSMHSKSGFTIVSVANDGLELDADLGLEPSLGSQAMIRLDEDVDSVVATVTELGRDPSGSCWRLRVRFIESHAALLERARALASPI